MKKLFSLALLLMSTSTFLYAQIQKVRIETRRPKLYEKTEWNINLTGQWKNPYLQEQVALNMLIVSPSGKKLFLPCYYQSGESGRLSLWKARFTPQETGKYFCSFQLLESGKETSLSKAITLKVRRSSKNGFLHPYNNWIFKFDDGKPFRGIGENIGWESRAHDDSKYFKRLNENPKYNYQYLLTGLKEHGGDFFRTWICRWNLPIDWHDDFNNNRYTNSDAYFNPSAVKRMDWMIHLADSLGLHMMLTLGPGAYRIKNGGFATSAADFFVNPQSIARYKNRLRYIIARWGYSSAIAAYELFNEVDNVMYSDPDHPINAASIVKWHQKMSAYIKKIDPYGQMVTTSISYRDIPGLNTIPDIDFNQKHIYKNTESIPSTILQYEDEFHKPYVIGEFAYEWDWSKDFNLFKNGMISDYKRGLWYGLFSPTPILPMSWWWEYFDSLGTDKYMIRVRTILDQMLAAGKGSFRTIEVTASLPEIQVFGVRCGNKDFVYVYNPDNSTKTIGIALTSNLTSPMFVNVYNCETAKYSEDNNAVTLGKEVHISAYKLKGNSDAVFILSGK
ncbi:MAG: DUF5060 domain-containing protein [Chitinophagaceae bacterium]